ncbi:DNA alkylation repair protein [Lysinibacillus sp. KU-BSD001]|uniref:DNA alkylation repair protein n=1 Tax=Lysinibacillus sp. KU-BSD001 TaxID=3141328 RepID=UPI0036EEB180
MGTQLEKLAEPKYKAFTEKLVETKYEILGVRIPTLRQLAKDIVRADWQAFIEQPKTTFEEMMLEGFVIASVNIPVEERFIFIGEFIKKIDNWSLCDSFCSSLKITKKYPQEMWNFLMTLRHESHPFVQRFIIVMMLMYYLSDEWIERVFQELQLIQHDDYYVKMAVAWAISIAFIKQEEKTRHFLQTAVQDDFTFHKALQKIRESRKVSGDVKEELKHWKRVK